jgi:hypothetical protein
MSRGASIRGLTGEGLGSPNSSVGRASSSFRTAWSTTGHGSGGLTMTFGSYANSFSGFTSNPTRARPMTSAFLAGWPGFAFPTTISPTALEIVLPDFVIVLCTAATMHVGALRGDTELLPGVVQVPPAVTWGAGGQRDLSLRSRRASPPRTRRRYGGRPVLSHTGMRTRPGRRGASGGLCRAGPVI